MRFYTIFSNQPIIAQRAVTFAFAASDTAEIFTSVIGGIRIGIGKLTLSLQFVLHSSSTIRNTHGYSSPACCVALSVIWVKWFHVADQHDACQWFMYQLYHAGTV